MVQEADRQPPHKIDENMWRNREQIEEIIYLLEVSHWPSVVRDTMVSYLSKAMKKMQLVRTT